MTRKISSGAKLCIEDIPLIRGLLVHRIPVKDIAEKFECSPSVIYRIKNGQAWAHVRDVAR